MIHWLHAMTFELLAFVFVLPFLRLFRLSKNFQKPVGNLQGKPILLVHGYCNDGSVWRYMKKRIAEAGMGPIYTVDLGSPFRSIREYALKVKEKAEMIRQETNRSDLILIGHSMGGLVSSIYATDFAPPDTVTDVITIGSPLGGTHIAKVGIGPNAKEMRYKSELVEQLGEKIAKQSAIRFYHIGTNTDQLIIPAQSALLKFNAAREFFFEDIGHASMLMSPRVANLIAYWLKEVELGASEIA